MARKSAQTQPKSLSLLEKKIGYSFRDRAFLELALTHPSTTIEEFTDNERLEFLGDSVLSLSISEHLYRLLPRSAEGELTRIKSSVVSTTALAQVSRGIKLSDFMRIGKGLGDRSKLPDSVHANVTEAVFAAVYMDSGYPAAKKVIVKLLSPAIETIIAAAGSENAKSQLQELAQKEMNCSPHYRLISESGPQHGKTFVVAAELSGRSYPEFAGHTKKEAEQGAARLALEAIRLKKQKPKAPAAPRRARDKAAKKPTRRAGRKLKARKQAKAAAKPAAKKPAAGKPAAGKPAARKRRGARRKAAPKRPRKNPYDALGI